MVKTGLLLALLARLTTASVVGRDPKGAFDAAGVGVAVLCVVDLLHGLHMHEWGTLGTGHIAVYVCNHNRHALGAQCRLHPVMDYQ
jgi:hypothetical protein